MKQLTDNSAKMGTKAAVSGSFETLHPCFDTILGPNPKIELLCSAETPGTPLFHEACIYHQESRSIYVTSHQIRNDNDKEYSHTANKHIKLFRIYDDDKPRYEEVTFSGVEGAMLNGGVNENANSILLCAQGSRLSSDISGIISLSISDNKVKVAIGDFYGIPFNSPNDVIVHPQDGSIWFTDPCYGYAQEFRQKPLLPNQVYRFDRSSGTIRAVANDFVRPNGLCFSPDLKTLYITDTGAIHGSSKIPMDLAGPSHIYAFDVIDGSFLANRRLFAYAPGRVPDGIKCDTAGNVYSGCHDGIEVWNPLGDMIGVIKIEGGCANFCFGERGVLYACNEDKFWKVSLNEQGLRGALLGI